MKTKVKNTLGILILIITSHFSNAQDWIVAIEIDIHGANCAVERLTTVTWSYTDTNAGDGNNNSTSGSGTISTTQPHIATFSFSGISNFGGGGPVGSLSISASGTCDFWMPPASGTAGVSATKT